jgi:hypothetical protein
MMRIIKARKKIDDHSVRSKKKASGLLAFDDFDPFERITQR